MYILVSYAAAFQKASSSRVRKGNLKFDKSIADTTIETSGTGTEPPENDIPDYLKNALKETSVRTKLIFIL